MDVDGRKQHGAFKLPGSPRSLRIAWKGGPHKRSRRGFSASSWIDKSGNFWIFGGDGYDSTDEAGYLDDLWMYTPSATGDTGQWTWMGGNTSVGRTGGQIGVYGTLGVAGNNIPGRSIRCHKLDRCVG